MVIEKDNIVFKRNYTIEYQPIKIVEEEDPLFYVSSKNLNPSEIEIVDSKLYHEISNFDTNNNYFKIIIYLLIYLKEFFFNYI